MTNPVDKANIIQVSFYQCAEKHPALRSPQRDATVTEVVREALTPDPASPRFAPDFARERLNSLSGQRQLPWDKATDASLLLTSISHDCRGCDKPPQKSIKFGS